MKPPLIFLALLLGLSLTACKAKPPGKFETGVMTRAKRGLFVRNKKDRNPKSYTKENVIAGREAFSHYCAACHGLDGQNTGVPFAGKMSPPVPSLKSEQVQSYTDGQMKWIIDNGLWPSGMPASKGVLNEDEIWQIVVYIRHLPPAGTLGEPAMYTGDTCSPSQAAADPSLPIVK